MYKLPKDLLPTTYTDSWIYTRPRVFLCQPDKTKLCQLDPISLSGTFKFNAYSEIQCTVGRTYEDFISGEQKINPFYDKIEGLRLLYIEGFGYFEIQEPEIISDGIREVKEITAYSLEHTLSQKYIEEVYINTGEIESLEVAYADEHGTEIVPISLYNPKIPELSLLHLCMQKIYGWSFGHIDNSLRDMTRKFEIQRTSVYDFFVNDISDQFNCFFVFDTENNEISVYAESLITKFKGDGITKQFPVTSRYDTLDTVSIDSYKTTKYSYNKTTGILTFDSAPAAGASIEVVDGSQAKWMTDVYISFENLSQEVNVSYDAGDIKTVLTVRGDDDLGIEEVNMGLPYITDLSYYHTVDWMGQELYDAYNLYIQKSNQCQNEYTENANKILELEWRMSYEENRVSLEYAIASHITSETVGTYYVRGGTEPDYYYKEVTLPDEYSANVSHYYTILSNNLNEDKVANLLNALQVYYMSEGSKDISQLQPLAADFAFVEKYTFSALIGALSKAKNTSAKDTAVKSFLDEMFDQVGLSMVEEYIFIYKQDQQVYIENGANKSSHEDYFKYYVVTLLLNALDKEKKDREAVIEEYQTQYDALNEKNAQIQQDLLIDNNFTPQQRMRLSAFLREDEYTDNNFVITEIDSNEIIMQMKKELLECGRIELSKLCEPKLEFSMDMANIYALPEFEPIIHQFQIGNFINIAIRRDYIKRARLLEVSINFDDFSDFSCKFGELTNFKTPSSVHADLLSQALSAGKSVASNASYWNKGADLATKTDLKIQQGLLDATSGLYSSDQGVVIDKSGIRLTKIINKETGEVSPYQAWIVNNNILFSTDGFKTSQTGLGEFEIDGTTFYGLLAQAVLSGYIEGSTIVGGTINIGNGTFIVDEFGNVTMGGDSKIGNLTAQDIQDYIENENNIVYSSCPAHGNYLADEIWIVGDNDYIQTDENGNVIDSSGNIISQTSMGTINDTKTCVLDSDNNIIGIIEDKLVTDANGAIIGVYDEHRNVASLIVGYIQDGVALDVNNTTIGEIDKGIVINEGSLVGIISGDYIISAEIIGTTDVCTIEPGAVLRSINDGDGIYKSTDWVSALGKYDTQHNTLNNRVGTIEGNLDQHFEFSNDDGLIIKDGNSTIYTRLLNDRWSFMQQDDDPLVGDAEVAYISNKKLYISNAEITGINGEDGNLDVNGPATVKELRVDNEDTNNSLVIQTENNGSFSILIQTQGG